MRTAMGVILIALAAPLAATPARAEHASGPEPRERPGRPTSTLDIDVRVGRDGFRLGGRLFGPGGVWGAWLNGRLRSGGLSIDGRIQEPGGAFNFKLDADVLLGGGLRSLQDPGPEVL